MAEDIGRALFQALLAGSKGLAGKKLREQQIADEMRREMQERERMEEQIRLETAMRDKLAEKSFRRQQEVARANELKDAGGDLSAAVPYVSGLGEGEQARAAARQLRSGSAGGVNSFVGQIQRRMEEEARQTKRREGLEDDFLKIEARASARARNRAPQRPPSPTRSLVQIDKTTGEILWLNPVTQEITRSGVISGVPGGSRRRAGGVSANKLAEIAAERYQEIKTDFMANNGGVAPTDDEDKELWDQAFSVTTQLKEEFGEQGGGEGRGGITPEMIRNAINRMSQGQ